MTQPYVIYAEEQAKRQKILEKVGQTMMVMLNEMTGQPPMACLIVVHFPNDVLCTNQIGSASPQAQMTAIDKMMELMSAVAEKMRNHINLNRHKSPAGTPQH